MAAIERTVKGFRDRSVGLQEIDRGQGRMVGDQVGGVNHDVGAGTGKDRTRVGDGAGVEGKDRWQVERGMQRSKGLKVETRLVQNMICSQERKELSEQLLFGGGERDEINFGRFQLEPPVGYPNGNAQQQLAFRAWSSREKL